jgi:tetratricopeptide (TPR) repeat protein
MQVALATCLLTQNKEPERACSLLEQAFATSRAVSRADQARRTGRYAYALAACGRQKEAEARIQEAIFQAEGLKRSDQAGVHYFVGEAWRSLGNTAKARTEFDQAVALSPDGVTALSAKKAMGKMRGTWHFL